ncbi:MAG: glycosyltransferase [Candidatus Dojkabacteria bacterium]
MSYLIIGWIILQICIGYNLFFPLFLLLINQFKGKQKIETLNPIVDLDYAMIVTAYEETNHLPKVVQSILDQNYQNFLVYVVADKCDISDLNFNSDKVILLRPENVIASNTGSHQYALDHLIRSHDFVTIIDSDNIVEQNYLNELNKFFQAGYSAVQGIRAAKNLDTTYACLDAARDIYYHFYDGKVIFNIGSSATLAGSGMAFRLSLYQNFLKENKVSGAGFDKVLQAWIVGQDIRIAFNENAIVYDEKTTQSDQLVKQRSRWINTWFKYFKFGFSMVFKGFKNLSLNQFIFGFVLLRPPLFIFLILSIFAMIINFLLGLNYWIWLIGFVCFVASFLLSLINSQTDKRIYSSLINIPKFIFYQVVSLFKAKNANKISVATRHFSTDDSSNKNIK